MDILSCEFTVEPKGICHLPGQKGERLSPLPSEFPTQMKVEAFAFPSLLQWWPLWLGRACSHDLSQYISAYMQQIQLLVKETGGSNLWTIPSLVQDLQQQQGELRDLWVTGKEEHGFLRCNGTVFCPWGDTNLLWNKIYALRAVRGIQQRAGIYFTPCSWSLHSSKHLAPQYQRG